MLTSKSYLQKTNIVLIVLTSLCVISAATALSVPCWTSSASMIGPIGMNLLATVTVALIASVTYSIMKNNEISELKAPRIVTGSYQRYLILQVINEDLEFIEENYSISHNSPNRS